ncbi:MAG TPA: hypothetical protein VEI74_13860 [Candidatus Methylomirabilis sp.]|nr:hypothetical protein [Candidatus Methylomirabilis sp.]
MDWIRFRREAAWLFEAVQERAGSWRGEVLIHSTHGFIPALKEELIYGAMLAWQGYRPVFLITRNPTTARYLRLLTVSRVVYWDDYDIGPSEADRRAAVGLVDTVRCPEDLVSLEHEGVAVGRHALSWFMRTTRSGTVHLERHRTALIEHIAQSLSAARGARAVLNRENAAVVLMIERGYTPFGEFFDLALQRGRRVVQYVASHQDDAKVYKAYSLDTRTDHPYSLSPESWTRALRQPFGEHETQRLLKHWEGCYASRTWFNFQRLQHLTRMFSREEIAERLGLDASKKTAIIFAHIFWDATFFYGDNLYFDYQRWFVETIKLANSNPSVNWVIKLHPVNVWRLEADGVVNARYSELVALEEAGITLAPHLRLLLPDTEISTWSLFQIGDYCVTVRGTVGIEMAALGKRVVTAGSGHYSSRGFTTSPTTIAEYENILLGIEKLPPASAEEKERAVRYAYWLLWEKPYRFGTFKLEYCKDKNVFHPLNGRPRIMATNREEIFDAPTTQYWVRWLTESQAADCIYGADEGEVSSVVRVVNS